MAEGFARRLSNELAVHVDVSSAGIVGWDDSPATSESIAAARERGADITAHRARRLEPAHLDVDLIVCMTTEHRDAVVRLVRHVEPRTFTLKELVRLLESTDASGSVEDRIRAADELRRSGFDGMPSDEDVADPIGLGLDTFRAVAWEIDEWTIRLMRALFVSAPAAAPRGSA